jgi:hypothetical protein
MLMFKGKVALVTGAASGIGGATARRRGTMACTPAVLAGLQDRRRGVIVNVVMIGPDGTGTMDVRSLMQTDDGALIFVHYYGRVDLASGPDGTPYSAPQFETGDARNRWLNKVQAVGKGRFDGTELTYDLYQLA